MPVEITSRYVRVRIKDPKYFSILRTKDIGEKGYSKIIVGRRKGSVKWETQSYLISVKGIKKERPQEIKLLWDLVYPKYPKKFHEIVNRFIKKKSRRK